MTSQNTDPVPSDPSSSIPTQSTAMNENRLGVFKILESSYEDLVRRWPGLTWPSFQDITDPHADTLVGPSILLPDDTTSDCKLAEAETEVETGPPCTCVRVLIDYEEDWVDELKGLAQKLSTFSQTDDENHKDQEDQEDQETPEAQEDCSHADVDELVYLTSCAIRCSTEYDAHLVKVLALHDALVLELRQQRPDLAKSDSDLASGDDNSRWPDELHRFHLEASSARDDPDALSEQRLFHKSLIRISQCSAIIDGRVQAIKHLRETFGDFHRAPHAVTTDAEREEEPEVVTGFNELHL